MTCSNIPLVQHKTEKYVTYKFRKSNHNSPSSTHNTKHIVLHLAPNIIDILSECCENEFPENEHSLNHILNFCYYVYV